MRHRRKYVFDKKTNTFVEINKKRDEVNAPAVHGDEIKPTRHPATGEVFESRCRYNAATRAAGLTEVGNEEIKDRTKEAQAHFTDDRAVRDQRAFIEQALKTQVQSELEALKHR